MSSRLPAKCQGGVCAYDSLSQSCLQNRTTWERTAPCATPGVDDVDDTVIVEVREWIAGRYRCAAQTEYQTNVITVNVTIRVQIALKRLNLTGIADTVIVAVSLIRIRDQYAVVAGIADSIRI